MGNAGKVGERERARRLRVQAWTLREIALELGVSTSTVSVWVRDVEFTPRPRNRGHRGHRPHPLKLRKLAEIERCRAEACSEIGELSERELLVLGLALYAGEGGKTDGDGIRFANSDPLIVRVFVTWLRRFFDVDESRLRVRLYLHADLDLEAATDFWLGVTGIPRTQFRRPYRAPADATIRRNRHVHGCPSIIYSCSSTHRRVMGLIEAVLSSAALPG